MYFVTVLVLFSSKLDMDFETYNETNNFGKFWQGNQKSFKQSSTTKMEMFVLHYLVIIIIQWEL